MSYGSSSKRLSRIQEYLYDGNYEQAVEEFQRNSSHKFSNTEEVLLMAKAYFVAEKYQKVLEILQSIKKATKQPTKEPRLFFESEVLAIKSEYLLDRSPKDRLRKLEKQIQKVQHKKSTQEEPIFDEFHQYCIKQLKNVIERNINIKSSNLVSKQILLQQRDQMQKLTKQYDDYSPIMEGMPMFLVSQRWFRQWKQYVNPQSSVSMEHPGPITNFEIVDHLYNGFYDKVRHKEHTNIFVFESAKYRLLPKQAWDYLHKKYGGNVVKRFNIAANAGRSNEIITEVYLKKIYLCHEGQINKRNISVPEQIPFKIIQVTKKQIFKGVIETKLEPQWGVKGLIQEYDFQKNEFRKVSQQKILEDIDTVGKFYVYRPNQEKIASGDTTQNFSLKCNNIKCKNPPNTRLQFCKCKSVKYCDLDCLKQDRDRHRKKCDLEISYMEQKSAVLKNFDLSQKAYSGRKGLVGLRNLGNTCYMNSGLQCMSNTKQITDYFMANGFVKDINESNPLGTKGNLACAYAELMREMWSGNDDVVSPFDLKKTMGKFASQFSGYGQQDSQQFISYLVDGLQEDLNLVKKKQPFENRDEIVPDEQASKESEVNYSKRIRSYIRDLMVGQFKSTVECLTCKKVSVCFDPFMLLSLPIPSPKVCQVYVLFRDLSVGATKLTFETPDSLTFGELDNQIRKEYRKVDNLLFVTFNVRTFKLTNVIKNSNDKVTQYDNQENHIFVYEVIEVSPADELWLVEYIYDKQIIGFPRYVVIPKRASDREKQHILEKSYERVSSRSFSQNVKRVLSIGLPDLYAQMTNNYMQLDLTKKLQLLTFRQNRNFFIEKKSNKNVTLDDCLSAYSNKQLLEKQNEWYCNKCKSFMPATKQIEIYKSNKILVLAFKRFSRYKKIRALVDFPIEGLDMGPFLKSNKSNSKVLYDLYGVVNHYGSLGGGHYTAFCQNFLNKRWFEFNDSRVSEINRRQIITGDSYVLFFRRRDSLLIQQKI